MLRINVLLAMLRSDLIDLRDKVRNGTYGPVIRRYIRNLIGDVLLIPEWHYVDAQSRVWRLLDIQLDYDDRQFLVWISNQYPTSIVVGAWNHEIGSKYASVPYRRAIHMQFMSKIRVYDANGNIISETPRADPIDDHLWLGMPSRDYS